MESNVTPIKFRNAGKKYRRTVQDGGILRMDFPLFFAVIAICLFGVVMLFSASYYKGISEWGDGYHYVKSQIRYLIFGIAVMFGVSCVPYGFYRTRLAVFGGYAIMIILLLAAKFMGKTVLGAQRWIVIGGVSIQPSEIVKFILTVCMAAYMSKNAANMNRFFPGIIAPLSLIIVPCVLIYLQPNMSMLIIICIVTFLMMVIGGASLKQLGICGVLGAGGLFAIIKLAGYRSDRIASWLDPWKDPLGKSYQVVQSLFAFGNGGFLGQGLDASRQKLLYLPELENDYILAIIAEELGFIGVALLLAAYLFIIYRGVRIALSVKDRFAALVAGGITGTLAIQVIINVAVVTNTIPATGQTLPFISAGGSSLLVFLAAIGVLLNISRHAEKRKVPLFAKKDAEEAEEVPEVQ